MTYAFQTPDKLCFVLDLMNGMCSQLLLLLLLLSENYEFVPDFTIIVG